MGMCHTIVGRYPIYPRDQFGYVYHNIYLVDKECSQEAGYPHEILHALGIDHTHKRYDRDDYLNYYANRTQPEWKEQFEKLTTNNSKTYGVPYDFNSVMHYQSQNGILEAKDELYHDAMGTNYIGIAHSDFLLLNRLYKCQDRCENSTTVCQNGGFVNSRNCTECICPMAFGGAFCEKLPDDSSLPWYYI
uniref:Metalloendopeptidase n=1 Tax=Steinernema glaseri TaxID=37863 RepID=A0A1I7XWX3_9BILA